MTNLLPALPSGLTPATEPCHRCGMTVYWRRARRGGRWPCGADGEPHDCAAELRWREEADAAECAAVLDEASTLAETDGAELEPWIAVPEPTSLPPLPPPAQGRRPREATVMRRRTRASVACDGATVLYVRVSTTRQATDGESLDAQEARLVGWAQAMGSYGRGEVLVIRDEGQSAGSLDRPGMSDILERVRRREVARVVVTKLDRLTRSVRDLCRIVDDFGRAGTALVSLAETVDTASASGRMFIGVLTAIAAWEREVIGERTAAVLAHLRATGRVYCRVTPYGYRRAGDCLERDEDEQGTIGWARRQVEQGHSLRAVARHLTTQGVKSRTGTRWTAETLRKILRRSSVA